MKGKLLYEKILYQQSTVNFQVQGTLYSFKGFKIINFIEYFQDWKYVNLYNCRKTKFI